MTFEELRLCMAIHRANLGGRDRTRTGDRHKAVGQVFWQWLHLFGDSRFPWSSDDVLHWSMQYRKSRSSKMKVQVALAHATSATAVKGRAAIALSGGTSCHGVVAVQTALRTGRLSAVPTTISAA
jgi:hypothetical protein